VRQPPDADHVVLADPEGNEFCVVVRGEFLATTDLLGAIVFEPAAPIVGRFWSEATGWPMVYDQDGEVERLIALGARRIDIGQGDVSRVVLADPEGNEFCVLTPR
jgi:hypothetical protein